MARFFWFCSAVIHANEELTCGSFVDAQTCDALFVEIDVAQEAPEGGFMGRESGSDLFGIGGQELRELEPSLELTFERAHQQISLNTPWKCTSSTRATHSW